jgi:WD40 repeat protein
VRTISFNYDGQYIASASEDLFIDISEVETGRSVYQIPCRAAMNSVEWNPKYNLLAFAADDKNKYQADEGTRTGSFLNLSLMHYVLKIIHEGNVVCSFCTMYTVLI